MSTALRRRLARTAVVLVLLCMPVTLAGCGSGGHYLGNVLAHKIANHFAKTPREKRVVNDAFCLYSVDRALHDFRHHHLVYGALNAHQAIKDCEAGFGHHH